MRNCVPVSIPGGSETGLAFRYGGSPRPRQAEHGSDTVTPDPAHAAHGAVSSAFRPCQTIPVPAHSEHGDGAAPRAVPVARQAPHTESRSTGTSASKPDAACANESSM